MAKAEVWSAGSGPLDRVAGLEGELARLSEEVRSLEDELEALHVSMARQELSVIDGYVVAVRPGSTAAFVAQCPALRAVAQGETREAALSDLREAMQASIEGHISTGCPVPAKDTDAQCPA